MKNFNLVLALSATTLFFAACKKEVETKTKSSDDSKGVTLKNAAPNCSTDGTMLIFPSSEIYEQVISLMRIRILMI